MKKFKTISIVGLLSLALIGCSGEDKSRVRTETTEDIYLAGGCFWGIEEYMDRIEGVIDVTVGYANGNTENPTYEEVCHQGTGHAETAHVMYDTEVISLEEILLYYYRVIDPVSINKQGNDVGSQYRTGIYYVNEEDLPVIEESIRNLQREYDYKVAIEVEELKGYYLAEEYHQDYLKKNPNGYCHIDLNKVKEPLVVIKDEVAIDLSEYDVPSEDEIKKMLTEQQYDVAVNAETDPPYDNEYNDNYRLGIYVDVITGVPIFYSEDKFDAGTGWPSFRKPISDNVVTTYEDLSHNMVRTEVRSTLGNTHLGHVFDDGKGGLRYCINSSSLNFIPAVEMEEKGYGYLLK